LITRGLDNARVFLLIEQFSNYFKALMVDIDNEDNDNKPWLVLGIDDKLPSRFDNVKNLRYAIGHGFSACCHLCYYIICVFVVMAFMLHSTILNIYNGY
jgi:hypothetical protein